MKNQPTILPLALSVLPTINYRFKTAAITAVDGRYSQPAKRIDWEVLTKLNKWLLVNRLDFG